MGLVRAYSPAQQRAYVDALGEMRVGGGPSSSGSAAPPWTPKLTFPISRVSIPADGATGLTITGGKLVALADAYNGGSMVIAGSGAQALDTSSPTNGFGFALKLSMAAVTEYARTGGPTGGADHAMMCVSRLVGASTQYSAIISCGNSGGSTSLIGASDANKTWWGGTNITASQSLLADTQAWQIPAKIQRGGQTYARLNGQLVDVRATAANANPVGQAYTITGTNYGIGTQLYSGYACPNALLLDGIHWTVVSDVDVWRTERYLALRYLPGLITAAKVTCDGDSLTLGANGSGGQVTSPYPSLLAGLLPGKTFTVANMGIFGQLEQSMVANFFRDAGVSRQCSSLRAVTSPTSPNKDTLVLWGGSNDLNGSVSAATISGYDQSYVTTARAEGFAKIYLCTVIARGTFIGQEPQRLALNATRLSTWAAMGYDGCIDLAADARLSDSTNTTYYAADTVHLTQAGYAVVASLVAPAIVGSL